MSKRKRAAAALIIAYLGDEITYEQFQASLGAILTEEELAKVNKKAHVLAKMAGMP